MKFFIDDLPVGCPCNFLSTMNNLYWQIVFPYDRIYPGTLNTILINVFVMFNLLQSNMHTCVT